MTARAEPSAAGWLAAALERRFALAAARTTVHREVLAGLTTFLTMSYILLVNPVILGAAGMDRGAPAALDPTRSQVEPIVEPIIVWSRLHAVTLPLRLGLRLGLARLGVLPADYGRQDKHKKAQRLLMDGRIQGKWRSVSTSP